MRPVFEKEEALPAVVLISEKPEPLVIDRSIWKPVSLFEASTQLKLICVGEKATTVSVLGAAGALVLVDSSAV